MRQTVAQMKVDLSTWVPGFTPTEYEAAINRAYSELGRLYPWSVFEAEFIMATKEFVDTGGVDFNSGTTSITAATSVSAAWSNGESDGFSGMFIKKADEAAYYTITGSNSNDVTITSNYIGISTTAVASAGDGYAIFQHIYAVPTAIETVTHLMHDSYLEEMDDPTFENIDPDLESEGEPARWRNAGVNSAGASLVQIYPALIDGVYELRGRGRLRIPILTASETPLLDSYLVNTFAQVDLMQRKHMMNPATVTDIMLEVATKKASMALSNALAQDWRARTTAKYVHDNFFKSHHRGQKWYVSHDPYDA